jgi:hypothetical protein
MWSLAVSTANPPELDRVLVFGFLSMFMWLVCHKERNTSTPFKVGLVVSSVMLMAFAFLQPGAWPLGFVMATLTISTLRQWRNRPKPPETQPDGAKSNEWKSESRVHRLFGRVGSDN